MVSLDPQGKIFDPNCNGTDHLYRNAGSHSKGKSAGKTEAAPAVLPNRPEALDFPDPFGDFYADKARAAARTEVTAYHITDYGNDEAYAALSERRAVTNTPANNPLLTHSLPAELRAIATDYPDLLGEALEKAGKS